MLNRSLRILLSLVLIVPLVLIIYFASVTNTEQPTNETLTRVEVMNPTGYNYPITDREDLNVYLRAVSGASKIEKAVRDISGEIPAQLMYYELEDSYAYDLYLSLDSNECYYSDKDGVLYKLNPSDAQALAARDEFAYLFENSFVPTLTVSADGQSAIVAPDDFSWHFLRGEDYAEGLGVRETVSETVYFTSDDELDFAFGVEPDKKELTIRRGDQVVYSGDGTDLEGRISYQNDTTLICGVHAEWYETDGCSCYGSADYEVGLYFDMPARYTVVDHALSPGEFTIIKFTDLNKGEKVTLESDLTLPETVVHDNNGNRFVFLPIDVTNEPGNYAIKVITDGAESSFSFTVRSKAFNQYNVTERSNACSDAGKNEFDLLIDKFTKESVEERLWDDDKAANNFTFADPVPGATKLDPPFGSIIYDVNLSSQMRQIGLDLGAPESTVVAATAAGKVVYAGELAYSGKTVIIDHGFGVLSVYQNLSSIAVSAGSSVAKKDTVGTVGTTGYTTRTRTRYAVSMEGVYINPQSNYTYGIQVS